MKKLTGREAVKALMEGKMLQLEGMAGPVKFFYCWDSHEFRMIDMPKNSGYPIKYIMEQEWEIVREPMTWKGTGTATKIGTKMIGVFIPEKFENTLVKITVEEILE